VFSVQTGSFCPAPLRPEARVLRSRYLRLPSEHQNKTITLTANQYLNYEIRVNYCFKTLRMRILIASKNCPVILAHRCNSLVCYTLKILGTKICTMHIRVTLYWGNLIVLWLFYLVFILYCVCSNLFCNMWCVYLWVFVMCGCVYVLVL